jgi:hypothetical protein
MFRRMKKVCSFLAVVLALYVPFASQAQATDKVTTYKDENGWKLQVNGSDYYIKGVVWGYTPRNENYTYNLWGNPDDFVRKVLDYEFSLMKAAGVNTIRSFATIPPKWVTYIYQEYGIRTIINPLMGRYGYTVGGRWIPQTDYSDELTRSTLKTDMLEIVDKYKDVPGVLMFAFGNESNYALEWSASFEIEDLPVGEQHAAKAKYLYTLFNEVIESAKRINSNHPYTIVNGNLQYIELIAEYTPSLDLLGTNVYRGKGFTDMWKNVDEKLDLPLVLMEFGSDAFNAKDFAEDQQSQAIYLKDQWQEMYNKSYGNGEEGNSIGGFVFEWRDEWWKYKQTENLDIHDRNASWGNGGYRFDYVEGKNNMNEEWFGITRLGKANSDGVYTAEPRMAYDVMSKVWSMDPYTYKKEAINQAFNDIDMEYLALKSDVRLLKSDYKEDREKVRLSGGRIETKMILQGYEEDISEDGEEGLDFQHGEMLFLDFEFQPTDKISGQTSVNLLAGVPEQYIEIDYGQRGETVTVLQVVDVPGTDEQIEVPVEVDDRDRIEIYDFNATYTGEAFDLETFYHVPRYHWKYEGDFFGLLREATDIDGPNGMDIWNAKAPSGAEFVGKQALEGLKLVGGNEIYWGANPKAILKYQRRIGNVDWAFLHSEDVARAGDSATATDATTPQTRATTLNAKMEFTDFANTTLQVGGLLSATEKWGDDYDRYDNGKIRVDDVDSSDSLGVKANLAFDLFGLGRAYVAGQYAGIVADGGATLEEFGTRLPYSEYGNKKEIEGGLQMNFGDGGHHMLFPRFLYRTNLIDANPLKEPKDLGGGAINPGVTPRNTDDDPFAVLDNREAKSAEIMYTYDPTGGTDFYAWDNDWREDAAFAFNIGANYTQFGSSTDSYLFFFEPTSDNAAFGEGLDDQNVWQVWSRMVFNPSSRARFITRLLAANEQSDGSPEGGTRTFYEAEGKFVYDRKHILEGYVKKDAFGLYDFYQQFNLTFPWQYKLDYSYLLDEKRDEKTSSKVGLRVLARTNGEDSPEDEYRDGDNDYTFETILYFHWAF